MRKTAIIVPAVSLIAGIAGFLLRRTELSTVFDSRTGLAIPNAPITLTLIGVSIAAAALCLLLSFLAARGKKASNVYEEAFAAPPAYFVVSFILGVIMILGAVIYFFSLLSGKPSFLDFILFLFAACSGASLIVLARGVYREHGGGEMCLFSVVPSLFLCIWLILTYKNNASDPVILHYSYECLAIAAGALSFYYAAGYAFRKSKPVRTILCYLLTIFFTLVAIADPLSPGLTVIFAVIAANSLLNSIVFIGNLAVRPLNPRVKAPPQE